MLQLLADTRDVWLSWLSLAIATHIAHWCTVITVVRVVVLMRRLGSINQQIGGACVPTSYGCTPFAGCVLAKSKQFLPKWWTTSSQSMTVVAALIRQTCNHCVCPVTTARQLRRVGGALLGGRGSKSLRLVPKDALACSNFCACKLKTFFWMVESDFALNATGLFR